MKLVVIESPYAGAIELNLAYLDACIRDCIARGESPYASHKMLTTALDDNDPRERALGISAGLAWRKRADMRVFYVDRGISRGMHVAMQLYEQDGLPFEMRRLGGEWEL